MNNVCEPCDVVNEGEDDEMRLYGYKVCVWKKLLTWIAILLTAGILLLIFYWKPYWYLRCTHARAETPRATSVHLTDQYNQDFVAEVKFMVLSGVNKCGSFLSSVYDSEDIKKQGNGDVSISDDFGDIIKYFEVKKTKYVFSDKLKSFERLSGHEMKKSTSYFHTSQPLTQPEVHKRMILYGRNILDVHVTPIYKMVAMLVVSPFYVFQLFSIILWYNDEYLYFASAILLISIVSIIITTYTTRKMERALKNTIPVLDGVVVQREGKSQMMSPDDLVPGDIIEIPSTGMSLGVDAVLLTGNCIVNESMLTGESIPVTKTPLLNPIEHVTFDPFHHSKHTLFCGTKVIQTRYYGGKAVTAMVIRTGFMTAKGGLLRSIMFPKPVDFKFYRDSYFFILALAALAGIGMIYSLVVLTKQGETASYVARRTLDLVTIAVPPILPAALAVGIAAAQRRLQKRWNIYCIQPRYINMAGSINAVCFDKTGTLTEEGLDLHGVVPSENNCFIEEVKDPRKLPDASLLKAGMATCHSLIYIDGSLNGDPLDLKMFESTGWILEELGEESNRYDMIMPTVVKPKEAGVGPEIGILKQFTFSSALQRMSVITKSLKSSTFEMFAKGSPEMISSLCRAETVPRNFASQLAFYTRHGYRVIALAHREINLSYAKINRVERAEVENDLTFLGLLIMENRLKAESKPVIRELHEANIRTIMVTGDNMLTAVNVARECGFIPHNYKVILASATDNGEKTMVDFFASDDDSVGKQSNGDKKPSIDIECGSFVDYNLAMTGSTWSAIRKHRPDLLSKILVKCCVYARMSPDQKGQLVEELQALGYFVAMCGDGANDCGALKAAHAGISLSEAEACVASPFTSKNPNISCVPQVIKEGRCALVTSFGIFKYIAAYSLCQFASVLLLYWIRNRVTNIQLLVIDLAYVTTISMTFPFTDPTLKLHRRAPSNKLASFLPILSLVLHAIVMTSIQVAAFLLVEQFPWFEAYGRADNNSTSLSYVSHQNTSVVIVSLYQYISLAIIFTKGYPYRRHMFTNAAFLINILALLAISLWLTFYPTAPVAGWLELKELPYDFKGYLMGLVAGYFLISLALEMSITGSEKMQGYINQFKTWAFGKDVKYEQIADEMAADQSWLQAKKTNDGFVDALNKELAIGATLEHTKM